MSGFGKHSGPAAPPSSQTRFGTFPRPPSPYPPPPHQSPPFPSSAFAGSPRSPVAINSVRSPPLAYESSGLALNSYQSPGGPRRPETLGRVHLSPWSFESSHPVASPNPSTGAHGTTRSPPQLFNGQRSFSKEDHQINLRPSTVTSFVASHNTGTSISAKISRFQQLKRTRSPPSHTLDEEISRNTSQTVLQSHLDLHTSNSNHLDPARTRSPPLPFRNDNSLEHGHQPFSEGQQLDLSPSARDDQHRLPNSYPNLSACLEQSSTIPSISSYDSAGSFTNELVDADIPKQIRSPLMPPSDEILQKNIHVFQKESKRPSISPSRVGATSNALSSTSDSQIPQRSFSAVNNTAVEDASTRTTNYSVAKRTRSPPSPATDKVTQGKSYSIQDDTNREIQAKARRLARFKEELTERFENKQGTAERKASACSREQSILERQRFAGSHSTESAGDFTKDNISSDAEGLKMSGIIIGLCPDMCPEPEREERERKGDLDQYERVDGDRNQTNKFLAVKKYNRTAEREANLIRPMPVLQKTVDYLLNLLDQPYDDRFLGMYNFLWDRMRAIRMDLRMQHIFNQEAITMLEQMIRLHIIAMHELCEYTKGEGFSEGFDAHLNIEQMNKTSVELFQMYDDHRKKGINVPTEKEFRGYYALLKLDKHPGYKVEPAELSLDLAKMTPEIRQTPEVLFARDVARACRTNNFIAFFRLARKASYLQACLMHAHFAKLRTQALASLHSGLQSNQGLPIAHVAKWLAMEEEDIGNLLEYHGFLTKEFEEPYLVKEGQFLNGDQDYPTKLSMLVHQKRSRKIADDVSPPLQLKSSPAPASKEIKMPTIYKLEKKTTDSTFVDGKNSAREIDEEMPDLGVVSSSKAGLRLQPKAENSQIGQQTREDHQVKGAYISPWGFSPVHSPPVSQQVKDPEKPKDVPFKVSAETRMLPGMETMPLSPVSRTALQVKTSSAKNGKSVEDTVPHIMVSTNLKDEGPPDINQEKEDDEVMENFVDKEVGQANVEDNEIAQAKLKLIIRLWKRFSRKQRELREQKQKVANAALSSLSLGPPIRMASNQLSSASDFDFEHVMRERYEKHEISWSKLNVSDVVVDILAARNPGVGCLCWKLVLLSQINQQGYKLGRRSQVKHLEVGSWLCSKLMPSEQDDDELLISSSGLSIWKKYAPNQSGNDLTCCLSVVRDVKFDGSGQMIDGASAIVFLVSENVPWNVQKSHLHNLLMSIPSGSSLPLLILCGSYENKASDPSSTIIGELGLNDIHSSQVGKFWVVFLLGDKEGECLEGFFSDVRLREGLQWLASESPPQLDIQCIRTRELILTHLNPSLEMLEKMNDREVFPNHCISAFNEALDWSIGEISAAAQSNPIGWPCPEIALLPDYSEEHMLVNWYLPSIGWSSTAKIEPFLSSVRKTKLPAFPNTVSWFDKGANSMEEIKNLKSQLENCLIKYLTESSGIMTFHLAIKEADIILQQSARLELHGSSYYIIPKWTSVFRRIFNWQLTSLSDRHFASAYVLRHCHVDPTPCVHDEFVLAGDVPPAYLVQPSLDEMIVGCAPLPPIRGQRLVEAFQPLPRTLSNGANTNKLTEDERTSAEFVMNNGDSVTRELNTTSSEVILAAKTNKETDKLSKLLEQCNIVQNSIDEKLFLYF